MKSKFLSAALLAAGLFFASSSANAAPVQADIVNGFGSLGAGDTRSIYNTLSGGTFTEAFDFGITANLIGATVAVELDYPTDATISSVQIVSGTTNGGTFSFDDPLNVLASGGPSDTIIATLLATDSPFAVIVNGSSVGAASYGGSLSLSQVPIPAALPLFLTALAGMGLIGRRRIQDGAAAA